MLDSLRKNVSGFVGMVFIGLIAMSFAVWGIADIFTGAGNDSVLEVGDQEISGSRFQIEYQRRLEELSRQTGSYIGPAEGRRFGVDRQVLGRLAGVAALDQKTEELDLRVPDETVAQEIFDDPAFQGPFGRFDRQTFETVLVQNRISEQELIEDRRGFLTRKQLLDAVSAHAPVPDVMAEAVYGYRNERRVAEYLVLTPDMVGDLPEPTEEELAELHEGAPQAFSTPERRSFEVLVVRPELLAETIAISDEEARQAFEERRSEYDTPETRSFYQIPFAKAEDAAKAAERLRAGESIEAVLEGTGQSVEDVTQTNMTRRDILSGTVADAAFSLEEGAVSEPVETPLGSAVVQVTSIKPGNPAEFEEIKDELKRNLAGETAAQDVYDIYNRVEDERAAGTPLSEIANMLGLRLRDFEKVTRDGTLPDDSKADLPDLPQLLVTAFTLGEDEEIDPVETEDDGYYWINVTAVEKPALKPLDEVRDEVVAEWEDATRRAELTALAETLVARGNDGESFEAISGEFDKAVLTSPALGRNASSDTFSRAAVANLFGTPEGKFTSGAAGYGDSLVVMRVKEVRRPDPAANEEEVASLNQTLKETVEDDLVGTLVNALQQEYGVSVNQAMLDRVIGN